MGLSREYMTDNLQIQFEAWVSFNLINLFAMTPKY
jgi:hypothetical protein